MAKTARPATKSAKPTARSKAEPRSHVHLTHPDRVYWVDVGVTKEDLAEYYVGVWDHMAPHVVDRAACPSCAARAARRRMFLSEAHRLQREVSPLRHAVDAKEHDVIAVEKLDDLIELVQSGALEFTPAAPDSASSKPATASCSISIPGRASAGNR